MEDKKRIEISISPEEQEALINTAFLGYKYRKSSNKLYSMDGIVALSLIKQYYSGKVKRLDPDEINKNFVNKYIKNECLLEGVHDPEEVEGLGVMYEEMHDTPDDEFSVFSLARFHKMLYSKCPYPEFGGKLRNCPATLEGCAIDLYPYDEIFDGLCNLEEPVEVLKVFAQQMKYTQDYSAIREYVKEVMKVKCKLIQIHPFGDGNGRATRCFVNKLFQMAGIPPVYIKSEEKDEYKMALQEALRHRGADEVDDDSKYDMITNFYLYKICDSIIELDINKKIRTESKQGKYLQLTKQNEQKKGKK